MAAPRRILIVRPSALGDVARTVPALVSLKRAYPDAAIDWLVNDAFADVIAHHPDLASVIPFPRRALGRNPLKALAYMRLLRGRRYDAVFDLQGLARSGWLTWSTRAPQRIGPADARELATLAYTDRVKIPAGVVHTVDRMLAIVAGSGGVAGADVPIVRDMRLHVGPADAQWADDRLRALHVDDQPYALFAPTARWLSKRWPIERFIEIAHRLDALGFHHIVVAAAGAERPQTQPLLEAKVGPQVHDLVGGTSVGQLMALIARAELVVANDSAALHIAVGLGRRSVAIFGPTDPATVGPYRYNLSVAAPPRDHQAHYRDVEDQRVIAQVPTSQVWRTVEQVLAAPPPALIHD
jgi:lipopolysaccharide heptosyltransferase I